MSGSLLGTGPLARRAEDLMPVLRIIAGPDAQDPVATEATLGDPATVALDGLLVTTVEGASRRPMSREMRDARERAVGALVAAGARVRRLKLHTWRGALLPYLASLQAASQGADARTTTELLVDSGEARPTWRTLLLGSRHHTPVTRVALAADMLSSQKEARGQRRLVAAGRALAEELLEAIGDGVLLHPAHPRPAPRHGRTTGRPWLMTPTAVFNLAGGPVTEVPLGLCDRGLPVGVQVAAAPGADHVAVAVALELERVFGGWVPPTP